MELYRHGARQEKHLISPIYNKLKTTALIKNVDRTVIKNKQKKPGHDTLNSTKNL